MLPISFFKRFWDKDLNKDLRNFIGIWSYFGSSIHEGFLKGGKHTECDIWCHQH